MGSAVFTGPGHTNAAASIHAELTALQTITVGDMLYVGEGYRARIRERTFQGIDVNGAPFAPYSSNGPFYFYPNRSATGGRNTGDARKARATAAANRFAKTGRIGVRTPTGIKYASYAAAHAAHGSPGVTLYGMEQHPHMLDAIIVKAGGAEINQSAAGFTSGGGMDAFQSNQPGNSLALGFYGEEADRAKGHNEGTSKLPKREFFALNQQDLGWGEAAIAQRMQIRAAAQAGQSGGSKTSAPSTITDDRSTWVPF